MKYLYELKDILKQHKITGYSHLSTKKELTDLLVEKGLLEREPPPPVKKRVSTRLGIRYPPLKVTLTNVNTGEIHEFPSIYRAGKFIGKQPRTLTFYKDRVWKNTFKIEIKCNESLCLESCEFVYNRNRVICGLRENKQLKPLTDNAIEILNKYNIKYTTSKSS